MDPAAGRPSQLMLKVLPNLDIVVTGDLSPADRLLLDACATQTADRVWALREATLLAAMDAGRELGHLRHFLNDHTTHELPNPVTTLLTDVGKRLGSLRDLGVLRLVECADPALRSASGRAASSTEDRSVMAHMRRAAAGRTSELSAPTARRLWPVGRTRMTPKRTVTAIRSPGAQPSAAMTLAALT